MCGGARCRLGQDIEGCAGTPHRSRCAGLVEIRCISDEQIQRRQCLKDAAAKTAWTKGQHTHPGIRREDPVHARQVSERRKVGTAIPSWSVRWNAQFVVRGSGCRHRARNGNQDTHSQHQKNPRVGEMGRGRSNSGYEPSLGPQIQVGVERPAEMVPRLPRDVLLENGVARTYLRGADFEQRGLSEGCPTGQGRQQAHSEACRSRIEGLLRGDPAGSIRLSATDERINRALADAVERHPTRDPGVRSSLKRASAVSHPESEPQKKVALDTEQEPTPRPSVSHGGPSASGTRYNTTTRTDQSTHTNDATRETRGEPAAGSDSSKQWQQHRG